MYLIETRLFPQIALAAAERVVRKSAQTIWPAQSGTSPLKINNGIIIKGACALGVSVKQMDNGYLKLQRGAEVHYSQSADCDFESVIAWKICGDKLITQTILKENNLPVLPFVCAKFGEFSKAERFMIEQDALVVTKPPRGSSGGAGVTTSIRNRSDLIRGFARAYAISLGPVMVERHAEGRNYRLTVLDGRVLSVVERLPASVYGDGKSSVRKLIRNANRDTGQDDKPRIAKIAIDQITKRCLRDQSLSLNSIPSRGAVVRLRQVCNADQGGRISDVSLTAHDDYIRMALQSTQAVGARLAGVDLIAEDITIPYRPGAAWISEVNTTPALYIVEAPDAPRPIDVGTQIVERMFSGRLRKKDSTRMRSHPT